MLDRNLLKLTAMIACVLLCGCQRTANDTDQSQAVPSTSRDHAIEAPQSSKPASQASDSDEIEDSITKRPPDSAPTGGESESSAQNSIILQQPKNVRDATAFEGRDEGRPQLQDSELKKDGVELDGDDEMDSLDDYSEDDYVEDRLVRDSVLPPIDESWIRLSQDEEIWVDMKSKHVVVGGRICLRRGILEMFACPAFLKEHESVVAVNSSAFNVHAALLAVGAVVGSPVSYDPEYVPASGTKIRIDVTWLEDGQPKTVDAKSMVLNSISRKALHIDWVFGGSITQEDPNTGETLYGGDAGMLVCVSNFTIATMDLPIESSDMEGNWMFEAFTDNIPARGTRVLLTLKPDLSAEEPSKEVDATVIPVDDSPRDHSAGSRENE